MISSPVAMAPCRKHSKLLALCSAFISNIPCGWNPTMFGCLDWNMNELLCLFSPLPSFPSIVYGSAKSTFLIPPRSGREAAARMETEAASHLWPSQRAGYLLEGRGLITTRWAKSAQMVLLKLFPSAQRPAPPEVSWQHKGPHFSGASPTPCLTPLPLPPFQRRPEFQLQPRHELLPKNNSRPALFPLPTSGVGVERSFPQDPP